MTPVPPTYTDHVRSLEAAGLTEAGTVWQHGHDRVLCRRPLTVVAAAR